MKKKNKINIFLLVILHTSSFNTYMITWKQQMLSRGKQKYEKSLHAHRFAKRQVYKHPSVFLNVIDGENISGALTELYLRPRFQRSHIPPPRADRSCRARRRGGRLLKETFGTFVYSEKAQAHITKSSNVTSYRIPFISRIIRI